MDLIAPKNLFAVVLMGIYFIAPSMITKALPIWFLAILAMKWSGKFWCYHNIISIGLVFSSFGDISLEISGNEKLYFLLGVAFFLIAHLFYIAAFWSSKLLIDVKLLAPIVVFYTVLMSFVLPKIESDLIFPVVIYGGVISTMVYTAFFRLFHSRDVISMESKLSGAIGALIFLSSDTCLALDRFVTRFPNGKIIVMVTYYIGQYLICASATSIRSYCKSEKKN